MAHSPKDDAAARLDQVTDDLTPRQECIAWLLAQMREGRDPDALLSDLVANGWSQDDAEPLVDQARDQLRGARGVLGARDEAARATDASAFVFRGGGIASNLVFGAANLIKEQIAAETGETRCRIKHGLCHKCGCDVTSSTDRCPQCGSAIVRRSV